MSNVIPFRSKAPIVNTKEVMTAEAKKFFSKLKELSVSDVPKPRVVGRYLNPYGPSGNVIPLFQRGKMRDAPS